MSEMTATRTTIGIMAAALWLGVAWLLWRTSVPDGVTPSGVPLGASPADVERARAWAAALPFRLALHRRRRSYGLAAQSDLDWLLAPWLQTLATAVLAAVALVL